MNVLVAERGMPDGSGCHVCIVRHVRGTIDKKNVNAITEVRRPSVIYQRLHFLQCFLRHTDKCIGCKFIIYIGFPHENLAFTVPVSQKIDILCKHTTGIETVGESLNFR